MNNRDGLCRWDCVLLRLMDRGWKLFEVRGFGTYLITGKIKIYRDERGHHDDESTIKLSA